MALLLLVGAGLFVYAGTALDAAGRLKYAASLAAGLLAIAPPIRKLVLWGVDRLRLPNTRGVWVITIALALLSANYFIFSAARQGRGLILGYHDEHVYMIQAHMLARGRLWMPPLPLPDFFESFYLFTRPVYAGVYFPGTAAAYAPSIWLNVPPWAWAALVCGGCVGMLFRVLFEFTDGAWAMLGALLFLGLPSVHLLSVMVMSHPVSLLLGLLMTWAYFRWRQKRQLRWMFVTGALAGWNAITRPLDALCFAIPIAAAVIWTLRGLAPREVARMLLGGALAMAPFFIAQFCFDRAVTGHFARTPVTLWDSRFAPQWKVGNFHPDPAFRPVSALPRMQQLYERFVVPSVAEVAREGVVRAWARRRLPLTFQTVVPAGLVLLLAPLGALGWRQRQRWVVLLGLPLFVALYMLYPPFLNHYALVAAPAVTLLVVSGARTLSERISPNSRAGTAVIVAAMLTLAVTSLSELNPRLKDPDFEAPLQTHVELKLSEISGSAVVLFHFDPANSVHEEPVYNADVAWPDDARIIRAHDLGERNTELFRYYARRSPMRMIYLYDQSTLELRELGTAGALAAAAGRS